MTNQDVWKTKYRPFEARSISDEMPPIYNMQIRKAKPSAPWNGSGFKHKQEARKSISVLAWCRSSNGLCLFDHQTSFKMYQELLEHASAQLFITLNTDRCIFLNRCLCGIQFSQVSVFTVLVMWTEKSRQRRLSIRHMRLTCAVIFNTTKI